MIEAMKQALEALETCMYPQQKQMQAITSLRQAIAEAEKQEPVIGVEVKRIASGGFIGNVWWIHENLQEGVFHLYTHQQPKREWVGLNWDDLPEIYVGDTAFLHGAKWAEAKLKEKNT